MLLIKSETSSNGSTKDEIKENSHYSPQFHLNLMFQLNSITVVNAAKSIKYQTNSAIRSSTKGNSVIILFSSVQ